MSKSSNSAKLAARMARIKPFYAMDILASANKLQQQGRDIVHMEVGEPDFAMPAPIQRAASLALQSGYCQYSAALGLPPLREAIAADYRRQGCNQVAMDNIAITTGSSAALMLSLAMTCDPGQQVLLSDPGYPCNKHFVALFDATPEFVHLRADNGFQLDLEDVQKHWHDNIKAVLLASPANPTGACIDHDTLCAIADFVADQGAFLLLDEIYRGLQYGDVGASLALYNERTIIINSFSKFYGMTGWRVGWMVAAKPLIEAADVLAQNIYLAPPSLSQQAALAAFDEETLSICRQRAVEFQRRRDFMVAGLRELGFVIAEVPQGAFYIYAQLPPGYNDSAQFCRDLLEQADVAITPGQDFSLIGAENFVRFAYTADQSRLALGLERISGFLRG